MLLSTSSPVQFQANELFFFSLQKQAVVETEKMFPHVRTRIDEATARLEEQIALAETSGATEEELNTAREALKKGREAKVPSVA